MGQELQPVRSLVSPSVFSFLWRLRLYSGFKTRLSDWTSLLYQRGSWVFFHTSLSYLASCRKKKKRKQPKTEVLGQERNIRFASRLSTLDVHGMRLRITLSSTLFHYITYMYLLIYVYIMIKILGRLSNSHCNSVKILARYSILEKRGGLSTEISSQCVFIFWDHGRRHKEKEGSTHCPFYKQVKVFT